MDPIWNDSPRMQSHEVTDRLSAATALYTNLNSSDGLRALSSTMSKSEAVTDILSKSKARYSLSGEAVMVLRPSCCFEMNDFMKECLVVEFFFVLPTGYPPGDNLSPAGTVLTSGAEIYAYHSTF
jgi:hypothetical protein